MVKKRESIKLIRDSLVNGNIHPILYSVVDFIHPLLSSVENYEYYEDNLIAKELIDIYKKREINLSALGVQFGGFSETIAVLKTESSPCYMIAAETENYHISILVDEETKIIGATFVTQ